MMVMTAKVNLKKVLIILGVIAALIVGCILIFGGNEADEPAATNVADNDSRIAFLHSFGWQVSTSPVSSGQVKIPDTQSAVYQRYNELQKSQGYDLTKYAGQTVMRYVYKITNYPGATDPVYATVLVFQGQIIGGDVTDTAAKGVVQTFKFPEDKAQTLAQEEAAA